MDMNKIGGSKAHSNDAGGSSQTRTGRAVMQHQAPGYYRYRVGEIVVTDGNPHCTPRYIRRYMPARVDDLLQEHHDWKRSSHDTRQRGRGKRIDSNPPGKRPYTPPVPVANSI